MSGSAPDGAIDVSVTDGVASVVLDNPALRNALTRTMCLSIQDLMPRLDADPDIEVVTLRGAGDTFCAGAAIGELSSVLADRQGGGVAVDQLSRADEAVTAVRKPTVALVDGACMGGGWQLASACDFVVASERSVFAITPTKLGVLYPRTGVDRLVRQVGPATAKYILLTGDPLSASRAQVLGLVAEVVPENGFEARCRSLVTALKARSRFSMHTLKHLVDRAATPDGDLDRAWADAWDAAIDGPDMLAGVAAFLRHEQPVFPWRQG